MTMRTDVNCLAGHWPFRKLYKNTAADLASVHRRHGIGTGYVASLNAVFYNDPFEGDEELHEQLRGTPYKHVLTVNPELPGWERDIRDGIARFGIRGVRIYPAYHGYALAGGPMRRLAGTLERHRLPLFLTVRMEDERLDYLFKPTPLDVNDIRRFLEAAGERLPIVLLNIRYAELLALQETIVRLPNVFFDTSGLKDGLFVVEKLLERFPAGRLLYGSQYPLYCLHSTVLLVDQAEIDEQTKERIMGGSASAWEA
jgi:hypothetical protein